MKMNRQTVVAGIVTAAMTAAALAAFAETPKVRHWTVDPMGETMRLPDAEPTDGVPGGTVRITLARSEYEPGSFVVQASEDLGKVRLELSEFKQVKAKGEGEEATTGAVFPKANLDLKLVKVWWQNRNAWFNYFGDTGGFRLCPELLVNDEDLIRVDLAGTNNYARLVEPDGRVHEMWINPPLEMDTRAPGWRVYDDVSTFQQMKENFRDAKTLQPVTLSKGVCRQFFLTVRAEKDTPAGEYRGAVRLVAAADSDVPDSNIQTFLTVPVSIRVLPFELPRPKTYLRPDEDYYVSSYGDLFFRSLRLKNGNSLPLAERQLEAILRNELAHGLDMHWARQGGPFAEKEMDRYESLFTIDAMRRVGMRTDVIVGQANPTLPRPPKGMKWTYGDYYTNAVSIVKAWDETLGHHNVYTACGDEPSEAWMVACRPLFEGCQDAGVKFMLAGWEQVFAKGHDLIAWQNIGTFPEDNALALKWSALGRRTGWYGKLHVATENPALNRRQYGLLPYLKGFTGHCNYENRLGPYNDDSVTYRPMVNAYGTADGVLDTLQWEGFREGVDDIRYATLLVKLANRAKASGTGATRRAGYRALACLADLVAESADLTAARARLVDHILALRALVGDAEPDRPLSTCKAFAVPPRPDDPPPDPKARLSQLLCSSYINGTFEKGHAQYLERNARDRNALRSFWEYRVALYHAQLSGHPETVSSIVARVTAEAPKFKTNEVYEIRLTAACLPLAGTREELVRQVAALEKRLNAGVSNAARVEALEHIGSVALRTENEALVRALWEYRCSLLRPRPRKRYDVTWSDRPVLGPDSWRGLEVEETPVDRAYRGPLDFLVTDISTGDRGVGEKGVGASDGCRVTFAVVADAWGLHFRITDRNESAVRVGRVGGPKDGSFEMYIAPGADRPHTCLLWGVGPDLFCDTWNCAYDHAGYRRIDAHDPSMIRSQYVFCDDRVEGYLDLSWSNWYADLPDGKGDFEFELVRWGRNGCTWNGTKSIHGRSTWGRLGLELTPARRAQVYRRLLTVAKRRDERERVSSYWSDPVLGDPAFYHDVVKPAGDRLDAALGALGADASDADVLRLAPSLVRELIDFRYTVDAERARRSPGL